MTAIIILGLTIIGALSLRKALRNTPVANLSPTQQSLLALGLMLFVLLALTGKLGVLVPVVGTVIATLFALVSRITPVLLPLLLQYLPLLRRYQGHNGPAGPAPATSTVNSRFLKMYLVHATGELGGEILEGMHAGRQLKSLGLSELGSLYTTYQRIDPESARLLSAYIEREYGDRCKDGDQNRSAAGTSSMDVREALEILGLQPGATHDEIQSAHRRLMQKLHPDRGGSDYLAAKINEARDLLLGH